MRPTQTRERPSPTASQGVGTMRMLDLINLPRAPLAGQRLRVDHATLMGLDSGLDPGEAVVLRVRGDLCLATVVHVDFGMDETTYDLSVGLPVDPGELADLGAQEPRGRRYDAQDVMAVMCRFKRTEIGCEESCAHCVLNPDSEQGWTLAQTMRDLD